MGKASGPMSCVQGLTVPSKKNYNHKVTSGEVNDKGARAEGVGGDGSNDDSDDVSDDVSDDGSNDDSTETRQQQRRHQQH